MKKHRPFVEDETNAADATSSTTFLAVVDSAELDRGKAGFRPEGQRTSSGLLKPPALGARQ